MGSRNHPIASVQENIEHHPPTIQAMTTRIESVLASLTNRATIVDQRLSDVEDSLSPLSANHKKLASTVDQLTQKVDNLENYSRRNNLRIVNIPENKEGSDIKGFTTDLLKKVNDIPDDQLGPKLEWIHRLGPPRGEDNGKPRPIILHLLLFHQKEQIFLASRKEKELSFKLQQFFIFQDYSVTMSQKRAEYNTIKVKSLVLPTIRF